MNTDSVDPQEDIIFESNNFQLVSPVRPLITREDGGHLVISPKENFKDRLELTPSLAVEMAWITMLAGEAMTTTLRKNGIDLGIINYQDNKNWSALKPGGTHLSIHLYGRAKNAKIQKYGEAVNFPLPESGFYEQNEPLSKNDVEALKIEINELLNHEKYQKENWRIV